ncbi:MAG TPA: alpha/beta hydrolase [Jatrophihabitantaceae bacterium]
MAIPLRANLFWRLASLIDRASAATLTADNVRASSDRRKKLTALPGMTLFLGRTDRGAQAEDSVAELPDGTALPVRVYRPRAASGTALPVVVYFHGGGWVSGDARQSEWWCSSIAAQADVVVVSVDYRLAPEHPFPVPGQDCYVATVWVMEHAEELGVDATRLAVMGDSAGGNLSAVVCLMARDQGGPAIALQVLLYPSVEIVESFPSEDENAHAPVLTKADLTVFSRLYLGGADGTDPYASPLRGKHTGLPRALIQTAQHDPLRDHGPAYAAALRDSGVEVRLTNYVDAVHGYVSLPGIVPAARQALAEAVVEVRSALQASISL